MQTTTLTTGQLTNAFTLINPFEVEAADVGTAWHFGGADAHDVLTTGHFFPDGFAVVHGITELINRRQFDGVSQFDGATIWRFLARHHTEQRGFTRAVRPDNADNRAFRHGEGEIVDQNAVTVRLAQVLHFNNFIPQAWARWNKQFVGFVTFLVFSAVQFFEASQTGLAFRLTAFRALTNPLQLFLDRFTTGCFGRGFLCQTFIFLFQPAGIVTFPRDPFAAVKFEDPTGDIIEEVTVMGDRHNGTFEIVQETFQPRHGFCIQVVGRFVEQQHVWFFQQQAAKRNAAAFAP